MPRYFFNVFYGPSNVDVIGEDLPDEQAAWHEGTRVAGELFHDLDGGFQPGQEWRLEITDDAKNLLYVIRISGEQAK